MAAEGGILRSMPTAFVLGGSTNALGVVRTLGRAGIRTFTISKAGEAIAFSSRYCYPVLCPDPVDDPDGATDVLLKKGAELEMKGIVIPTSDDWVLIVSRNRNTLGRHFLFDSPPEAIVEATVNKRIQYAMAERLGIPIPRTIYPYSVGNLKEIRDDIEFPALIKPYNSHLWARVFPCKGFPVRTFPELLDKFKTIIPTGLEVMVQSVVMGTSSNNHSLYAYLDEDSKPIALFVHEKTRQHPTDFGNATMVEGVHDEEVVKLGLRFLQGLGYRGMGFVEFKRDSRDNELKLIELNPRQVLPNLAPVYAGVNFPLIQYILRACPSTRPPAGRTGSDGSRH